MSPHRRRVLDSLADVRRKQEELLEQYAELEVVANELYLRLGELLRKEEGEVE